MPTGLPSMMRSPTRRGSAEEVALPLLRRCRVVHAHRHLGEQGLEHARRREVIRRPDLAHVGGDMREIGPTYYFAPPRVFEALLTQVSVRMDDAAAPK